MGNEGLNSGDQMLRVPGERFWSIEGEDAGINVELALFAGLLTASLILTASGDSEEPINGAEVFNKGRIVIENAIEWASQNIGSIWEP